MICLCRSLDLSNDARAKLLPYMTGYVYLFSIASTINRKPRVCFFLFFPRLFLYKKDGLDFFFFFFLVDALSHMTVCLSFHVFLLRPFFLFEFAVRDRNPSLSLSIQRVTNGRYIPFYDVTERTLIN